MITNPCPYCNDDCLPSYRPDWNWWKCQACKISFKTDDKLVIVSMYVTKGSYRYQLVMNYDTNTTSIYAVSLKDGGAETIDSGQKRIFHAEYIIPNFNPKNFPNKLSTLINFS